MCDLLCISSDYAYRGLNSIPYLALLGDRNCHGWGIGYFDDQGRAHTHKSDEAACSDFEVNPRLKSLTESIAAKRIIGHVRYRTAGPQCECNCHPFQLDFLGKEWLFAHNGTCRGLLDYNTRGQSLKGATNDSPRIFEYLRDRILHHHDSDLDQPAELFSATAYAVSDLLEEQDDFRSTFNFVLASDTVVMAFVHQRPFWLLHRVKPLGDAIVMTTIEDGLTDGESWIQVGDNDRSYGELLLIVGHHLLLRHEIARGV